MDDYSKRTVMYNHKKIAVVITAAGMGARMKSEGAKKQFRLLEGIPVICHTIQQCINLAWIDYLVVVLPKETSHGALEKYLMNSDTRLQFISGGDSRFDSVYKGLAALRTTLTQDDVVMIHDGVRPFADEMLFERVMKAMDFGIDGVIPAIPVTDTVKKVDENTVQQTVDRSSLRLAQTPQAFLFGILWASYQQKQHHVTDDAAALQMTMPSAVIQWVEGHYNNIKITVEEDLIFAEFLLQRNRTK